MRRLLIAAAAAAMLMGGPAALAEPTCTPTPVVVCAESSTDPNPAAGASVVDPASGSMAVLGLSGTPQPPLATACAIVDAEQANEGGCVILVSDGQSQATIFVIRFGPEPSCQRIDLPSGEQTDCS